jgi:hypothetical protein
MSNASKDDLDRLHQAYSEAADLLQKAGETAKANGMDSIEFADADRKAVEAVKNCQKIKARLRL